MTEIYAERETQASRGDQSNERVRIDADGSENAGQLSEGIGVECLQLDRENSSARNFPNDALGGILDQLIDDAEKQLVKSRECIVWYREEAKECEEKLNNLIRLRELQRQQQQQQIEQSDGHSGENLAE